MFQAELEEAGPSRRLGSPALSIPLFSFLLCHTKAYDQSSGRSEEALS